MMPRRKDCRQNVRTGEGWQRGAVRDGEQEESQDAQVAEDRHVVRLPPRGRLDENRKYFEQMHSIYFTSDCRPSERNSQVRIPKRAPEMQGGPQTVLIGSSS